MKSNQQIIEQFFAHFNDHEWDKMAGMYLPNAAFKDPSFGQGVVMQSREEISRKYAEMNAVFPDLHDEVIAIYPSGDKHVIVEFVSSGTAPDGERFSLPICTIFTIENGMISRDFTYYDNPKASHDE